MATVQAAKRIRKPMESVGEFGDGA
jgi:hypothetical protein